MTREEWLAHVKAEGITMTREAIQAHAATCPQCAERRKTRRASRMRRERDDVMRSCGLVKVRGAVSGRTYWE